MNLIDQLLSENSEYRPNVPNFTCFFLKERLSSDCGRKGHGSLISEGMTSSIYATMTPPAPVLSDPWAPLTWKLVTQNL